MKVMITEPREKVIKCDLSKGPVPAITDIHNNTQNEADFLAAIKELALLEPTFDFEAAFTESIPGYGSEYIVRCFYFNRFNVLDYIFDNIAVSPNFVTSNGSPLILFAMQQSWECFTYLVSRGAKLFRGDGELVKNTGKHPHVNVLFCANGNEKILNVVFNALMSQAALPVMDRETLLQGLSLGVSLGRPITQLRAFARHHKLDRDIPLNYIYQLRSPEKESPRGKLMAIVTEKCDDPCVYKGVTGLDATDIRWAMNVSMSFDDPRVYNVLCDAFPKNRIE